MVDHILQFKPTVVITEKGLSDFAAHHLQKAGVTAVRRLRKTDNNRVARACGATIVNRPEDIKDSDIGTGAGLFEVCLLLTPHAFRRSRTRSMLICTWCHPAHARSMHRRVYRFMCIEACTARTVVWALCSYA